jgi:hypothetical protein
MEPIEKQVSRRTMRKRMRAGVVVAWVTPAILVGVPVAAGVDQSSAADVTARVSRPATIHQAEGTGGAGSSLSTGVAPGPLVPDPQAYARAKADADVRAGVATSPPPSAGPSPAGPTTIRSWKGIKDITSAPSDSTGAIGTTRYVELVNRKFAIYDRTNNIPISKGSLASLVGGAGNVFDPQVVWDPGTSRFYAVADDVVSATTDNRLAVAFSTTASPNSAADWCKYFFGYGSEFPDYPKLGDTADFWMAGVNVFSGSTHAFIRTDLAWITKPPSGTTCPPASSFGAGTVTSLTNADSSVAWTPVPANQTDTNSSGHVVATRFPGTGSASFISVFDVTNSGGSLSLGAPRTMSVAAYSVPASAPQPGTSFKLDTLDTRLTQAVSAIDPFRGGVAIWTQHTAFGGAGAQVRWYEINPTPATPVPFQSGTETDGSLFLFNAAISPDRRVNGASTMFGSALALGFNRSSSAQATQFVIATKLDNAAISAPTVFVTSSAPVDDFSCGLPPRPPDVCRWGDYAAATPDPAASTAAARGQVWLTNARSKDSTGSFADWRTWNAAVLPSP